MKVYSDKQRELLKLWQQNKLKRINLLQGSVRSGKTWVSLVLWAFWVSTMPKDASYIMVAKTLTSLRRNTLDLLHDLVGDYFRYSLSKKEAVLFGRKVYLEGVNDVRAESKIRGMTLQGAYCDELTLFTEDFFTMLLSRLSESNAKVIATTNPDSPNHWLKKKYIDRQEEIDLLIDTFYLDDNIFLDPNYKTNLKKEYTGVFYERFILGKWVLAEGLIYPMFDKSRHITDKLPEDGEYYISIDYGTHNPFSAGLWCIANNKAYRIDEYYYSGRDSQKAKTDEEYYKDLERLAGDRYIEKIVIDPSASSFIECIKRHGRFSVRHADNDVVSGIRRVSGLLNNDMLLFSPKCKATISEFGLYSWDEKLQEDKPIKENDHAMDDIRYFTNTILRKEFRWIDWSN